MRFLSTRIHGIADYLVGIVLILAPWIFGFATGGPAQWIAIAFGVLMIGMALLTRYEFGLLPVIPMSAHLMLDVIAGVCLALSPWFFGFADAPENFWVPHLVVGLLEVGTAMMTQTHPSFIPSTRRATY